MTIPHDYIERTYAGVLGKIIGVYLGRPFEGWTYERIMAELGEITYYVHEKRGVPLIVTDDDIGGTFTFLRALPDYGNRLDLTPEQIGQTWLNYIVERRTILWWGGLGNSTEHTAYLRLKNGISAPRSGSIELNGKVVAEQIGSQIFIDGWAMVAPGDPERAADLARHAASVSHDGEAIYGAQVIAAMEAQAYVERDLNVLLDTALRFIPTASLIYRLINDVREWHAKFSDWHDTRTQIVANYGYDKYGGNCHIIPNHALIIMSLLHGKGDFGESLKIVNTAGWDTDCNSGNVGCLLGIKNGLGALNSGVDWRGPVADRMYLSTADGGRAITDSVVEAYQIVNMGRALNGLAPLHPKDGVRFHFEAPGAVQGFEADNPSALILTNVEGQSQQGQRSLQLHFTHLAPGQPVRAFTPTFIPPEVVNMRGYGLMASPTLYPGQTVRAGLRGDAENRLPVTCQLYIEVYGVNDELIRKSGAPGTVQPGAYAELSWQMPDMDGMPIARIGLELSADEATSGSVYLDYLTWEGTPDVTFKRPQAGGSMWRRAWVDGTDQTDAHWPETYRVVQNRGTGLLMQGTREWVDYTVSASLTPHLVNAAGIGARVQGMARYYALLLQCDGTAALIKALDGIQVLASTPFSWEFGKRYALRLQVKGRHLQAWIDDQLVFDVEDANSSLTSGAIALICTEGRVAAEDVRVLPI